MKVPKKTISKLADLIEVVEHYSKEWICRGQAKRARSWRLLPKAGRPWYFLPIRELAAKFPKANLPLENDLEAFNAWRGEAISCVNSSLPKNEIECLAFAQHYGLFTRLLDWTSNPLVALYFAAETDPDDNGAFYAYHPTLFVSYDKRIQEIKSVSVYVPRPFDLRILRQSSRFTIHPEPEKPLTPQPIAHNCQNESPGGLDLVEILVKASQKDKILRELDRVGINRRTLFPDLEGLSFFINWRRRIRTVSLLPRD